MKLNYRENFELITGLGIVCSISIQDKTIFPILDTWSDGLINLTEKDLTSGAHFIRRELRKKFQSAIKRRHKKKKA